MDDVTACLGNLEVDKEIKRSAYVMFQKESANGTCGINEG